MTTAPDQSLFTPAQVATRLGLHVKTVRRYIREGELHAVRVGKRYRIPLRALEDFSGVAKVEPHESAKVDKPYSEVSSIVCIDAVDQAAADHVTNNLLAAVKGREPDDQSLRMQAIYDSARRRLKIIVNGSIASTTVVLSLINVFIAEPTAAKRLEAMNG